MVATGSCLFGGQQAGETEPQQSGATGLENFPAVKRLALVSICALYGEHERVFQEC